MSQLFGQLSIKFKQLSQQLLGEPASEKVADGDIATQPDQDGPHDPGDISSSPRAFRRMPSEVSTDYGDENYWDNGVPEEIAAVCDNPEVRGPGVSRLERQGSSQTVVGTADAPSNIVNDSNQRRLTKNAVIGGKRSRNADDLGEQPNTKAKRTRSEVPIFKECISDTETGEPTVFIAPSASASAVALDQSICWGIKWELIRTEALHRWDLAEHTISSLRGSHKDIGPRVASIILGLQDSNSSGVARESAVRSPWLELDREDKAWSEGMDEGIGLKAADGWYGGKVQFVATLDAVKGHRGRFVWGFERPVLGKSTAFGRAFHSRAMISVKIRDVALRDPNLKTYLKSRFILFGRPFYVLEAEQNKVILVDASAYRPGYHPTSDGDIHELLEYLNPLEFNQEQALTKWRCRFRLYFSDSVPGFRFSSHQVGSLDDKVLPHKELKCPSEKILTDGCGGIRREVLNQIRKNIKCDRPISAVQLRFLGSKGMVTAMHPSKENHRHDIYLRPSQVKIIAHPKYRKDEAKLTVDIVRPALVTTPARLSAETIQIMASNGVPNDVFTQLQQSTLEGLFKDLVDWPTDGPLVGLLRALMSIGGVLHTRRLRLAGGQARSRGLSAMSWDENEEDDDGADGPLDLLDSLLNERSTAWWPDDVSGCPSTIVETCVVNILAGFRPESNPYLRNKLRHFLHDAISAQVNKFRITVEHALTATFVPDHLGVLGPDEISVVLSESMRMEGTDERVSVLEGDCLVLRNPAKLPTDVRKVKLVNCPALHHLKDVIVMSTQSKDRSLASRLGGGDYDGDRGQVILQKCLVDAFTNSPDDALRIPPEVKAAFESRKGTVKEFLASHTGSSTLQRLDALQDTLLCPINISSGKYSIYHETAVRALGIGNPETIRLAYMFTEDLDGGKTGQTVRHAVSVQDDKKYRKYDRPKWRRDSKYYEAFSPAKNTSNRPMPPDMERQLPGKFVMDELREIGEVQVTDLLRRFDCRVKDEGVSQQARKHQISIWLSEKHRQLKQWTHSPTLLQDVKDLLEDFEQPQLNRLRDLDPAEPWRQAIDYGICMSMADLDPWLQAVLLIHKEIKKVGLEHATILGNNFTERTIVKRQDELRSLSRRFAECVIFSELPRGARTTVRELEELKASCAYIMRNMKTGFPFDVATRALGLIKGYACGMIRPCSDIILDGMQLHKGYVDDVNNFVEHE